MRVPTEKRELAEIVKKYPKSLIASNACLGGLLANRVLKLIDAEEANDQELVYKWSQEINDFVQFNLDLFGDDFYFELAAGSSKDQIRFNRRIGSIARYYGIKIVIGGDAHYLTAKERPIHKAYLNSKEGEREVDEFYQDAHLMDNDEAWGNLQKCGAFQEEDFLQMCAASQEICNKIEGYNLFHKPIIPKVEVKYYPKKEFKEKQPTLTYLFQSDNDQERYWVNQCIEGLKEKNLYCEKYLDRLETEANVIKIISTKLDNCLFEYFNTFQHYIDLFWECGSVIGPGRGSSVCFLSNYLMNITQLDPVEWNLFHWRFLNEERTELPRYIGEDKIGERAQRCA